MRSFAIEDPGSPVPPLYATLTHTRCPDDSENGSVRNGLGGAKSITDLAKRVAKSWEGGLVLKNSLFPTKLFPIEGDMDVVEQLLRDEQDKLCLKITGMLRFDQANLVSKAIISSTSHAIFLALPSKRRQVPITDGAETQCRTLRNLVSYLIKKEAAGVIRLQNKETEQRGALYVFPPCAFSLDLLRRVAGDLSADGSQDDHLVVVVLRNGATA